MPDAAAPGRKLLWQPATVTAIVPRTPRIKSFFFALPEPPSFVPGQHVDVRLTAPDGYEAQRSYSIASAPERTDALELAIERLQDGEVSPFFHDDVQVGDEIELRGPIGGHFIWSVEDGGPVLLIGGGSGVVPLASMVRHHAAQRSAVPVTLVVSAQDAGRPALPRRVASPPCRTRQLQPGRHGHARGAGRARSAIRPHRPGAAGPCARAAGPAMRAFVCGSNAFVEAVTDAPARSRALPRTGSGPSATAAERPQAPGSARAGGLHLKQRRTAFAMIPSRLASVPILALALLLHACASRPINPPINQVEPASGYRLQTRQKYFRDSENLVVLAFSGGGTRAAAFSYGVLESLRRTEVVGPKGGTIRLLDEVDVITGVSGGSFTALAYGLYGEKLFDDYERRFLKRDVQGELVARLLNPVYWPALWSPSWGRSELAAELYDEILFNGATFADLDRSSGPFIIATATDISTGARLPFVQNGFDILCSDLGAVPLSRAAAASSAVPVVLSPVTINNYGGTCNFAIPTGCSRSTDPANRAARGPRAAEPAGSARLRDGGDRPYIHLVDGGISDNLGMRGVLDALEALEALHAVHQPTPLDRVRRIIVIIVNSLSSPKTNWDQSESPPGSVEILLRATGVPIDHYSYEAIELLKDTAARWQTMRRLRAAAAFAGNKDPAVADALNLPDIDIYAINVSFPALRDKAELDYLNELPTTFVLPAEAVDRLRAAAGTILLSSPEFSRLLRDVGATVVHEPPATGSAAGAP